MPPVPKELTPLELKRLALPRKGTRLVSVGGVKGLMIQLSASGARSWLCRLSVGGRRRAFGLGSYPTVTLAEARERARELHAAVYAGRDPAEDRAAQRAKLAAAQARALTFEEATARYLAAKGSEFSSARHRENWRSSVERYAFPAIRAMDVADLTMADMLRVLTPIWTEKPETAAKLRQRLEAILTFATVSGHRTGENPARWKGNLKEALPRRPRSVRAESWPAIAQADAARWFAAVGERQGMAAKALVFLALTVARSGEVRGATWDEIDLARGVWTIPAARMLKRGVEHRVPLPARALELVKALPRFEGSPYVFTSPRGKAFSDAALGKVMRTTHEAQAARDGRGFVDARSGKPAVPHGLRSTFRDWASEHGYDRELSELALAHVVGSEVERAYRRADLLERRRAQLEAWAAFLRGDAAVGATVTPLRG